MTTAASTTTTTNGDAPVKVRSDLATVFAAPIPAALDSTREVIPNTPTAAPSAVAGRT